MWMLCARLDLRLSNHERAAVLLYLLERSPKKSISGFLEKTGS
jgi:hypothetical protein